MYKRSIKRYLARRRTVLSLVVVVVVAWACLVCVDEKHTGIVYWYHNRILANHTHYGDFRTKLRYASIHTLATHIRVIEPHKKETSSVRQQRKNRERFHHIFMYIILYTPPRILFPSSYLFCLFFSSILFYFHRLLAIYATRIARKRQREREWEEWICVCASGCVRVYKNAYKIIGSHLEFMKLYCRLVGRCCLYWHYDLIIRYIYTIFISKKKTVI